MIGCGNIGKSIINAIQNNIIECELVAILDKIPKNVPDLDSGGKSEVEVTAQFSKFLSCDFDLVIESASQQAVREYGIKILESKRDLMIMSTGALTDLDLFEEMKEIAKKNNLKIYLPSGAIAGVDGLKSAGVAHIDSVTITTKKNPMSLGVGMNAEIKAGRETTLYEGPAKEAVKRFPFNVNVAATLSLAGIGLEKTRVKVIADPSIEENIHQIHVIGDFGEFKTEVKNIPSPENPKTSYLAALSAIATLKKITEPIQIGT